jgi:hypothetical protein
MILHIHPAPQDVDPSDRARRPSDGLLAAFKGDLCKMLDVDFREFTFQALR